jgi:hypothetical protein
MNLILEMNEQKLSIIEEMRKKETSIIEKYE